MKKLAAVTLIGLTVAACATPALNGPNTTAPGPLPVTTVPPTTDAPPQATPQQRWEAAAIDDYHFTFLDDCGECAQLPPRQVVVWGAEVIEADRSAPSVADVFAVIGQAETDGRPVEVEYHPELGYPTDVWIDRPDRAFDGGTHWILADLAAGLPGDPVSVEELKAAQTRWDAAGPDSYEYRWSVVCDCPLDGTIRTRVEDGQVIDWEVEFGGPDTPSVTPITVDTMLSDLADLFGSAEGVEVEGVRFAGAARYHPEFGYPEWVGLDVEVLDASSDLAILAPRIVFIVTEFETVEPATMNDDLAAARERWVSTGLDSYSYQLTSHDVEAGSFSDPFRVTVADGAVVSVTLEGIETELPDLPAYPIDELFDLLAEWMASGINIQVLYHDQLGHPVLVMVGLDDRTLAFSIDQLSPA